MNLPEDIRNKEFSRRPLGYSIDEVEDYVEMLLEKYDALYKDKEKVEQELKDLKESGDVEKAEARKKEMLDGAKKEADIIIGDAVKKAAGITDSAKKEALGILSKATAVCHTDEEAELARLNAEIAKKKAELEELVRKTNEAFERRTADKKKEYAVLCRQVEDFKNRIFEIYSSHIRSLGSIDTKEGEAHADEPAETPAPAAEKQDEQKEPAPLPEETKTAAEPEQQVRSDRGAENPGQEKSRAFVTGITITREPAGAETDTKEEYRRFRERLDSARSGSGNERNDK